MWARSIGKNMKLCPRCHTTTSTSIFLKGVPLRKIGRSDAEKARRLLPLLVRRSSTGKKGSSTLEILIAFAILISAISAVIMVSFGNQSIAVDTITNAEALYKAQAMLEDARALSRQNFTGVTPATTIETVGGLSYTKALSVFDLTLCEKQATSTITWNVSTLRPQKIELSTHLTDIAGALALGGDCTTAPPNSSWKLPARFASDTLNPGKPTAIDVLSRIAYLGLDKTPFFTIADTRSAILGQNSGLFIVFANGFDAGAQINALDTVRWTNPATGDIKYYVFAAMNTVNNQLKVIDATDRYNPVLVATRSFSPCVTGSFPQGWRVAYYKDRLYLATRYTAGPEFHIFDVTTPASPTELGGGACKGTDLGNTVNQFVVRDQVVGTSVRRFVYMATDEFDKELRVFDVTGDTATEVTSANQNLPGAQNGMSVYLVGNKLYFGRQSTPSGPDFYVFDVSNPPSGLTTIGSQDIGTGVVGIRVAGSLAFLSTPKTKKEFQVWSISDLANIVNVATYNFGNMINQGIDYEPDYIYATGQSTPNFQVISSP